MSELEVLNNGNKKIKVGDFEFSLNNFYPYVYDYGKGKEVLRIEVLEEKHTFDELLALKDNKSDIIYFENDVEKVRYQGYYQDFVCNYQSGIYSIEITRVSQTDLKVIELENQLKQTNATTDYLLMLTDM